MASKDTISVRVDLNGLRPDQRELYRALRNMGFPRYDANLVVFGAVLESISEHQISLRADDVKVTIVT